jgi:hypothetical protein
MKRSITWEKWIDIDPEDVANEESYEDEVEIEDEDGLFVGGMFEMLPLKVNTPLGTYEYNEPLSPSKMYDCWVGHTNFRLMDSDVNVLENEIDGIEQFKSMSRYRFFVGIAKMFEFKKVRIEIDKKICKHPDHLKMKDGKWSMFLGNDGTRKSVVQKSMSDEDYEKKVNELKEMKNGSVITSEPI